ALVQQFFLVGRHGFFVYFQAAFSQPGGKALRLPQVFFYRGGAFFFLLQKGGKGAKLRGGKGFVLFHGVCYRSPFTTKRPLVKASGSFTPILSKREQAFSSKTKKMIAVACLAVLL